MDLYPFQKRVANLILSGKSVILQAPTGSGKTIAALQPFLEAWSQASHDFPRKCVYIVPMRVLAHQFVASTTTLITQDLKLNPLPKVSIQTGDQSDDPKFESDLIFCTIDQFLSSYLTMPYGLANRLANLNAGAFVGSYLVFDEFHLLDPESTLPTAWYALKQCSKIAPVLLMTATFSKTMLDLLATDLQATVVTVPPEEARQIENRIPTPVQRQRVWEIATDQLSPEVILKSHQNHSLVLCNTVKRAQDMYRGIKEKVDTENLPIKLLLLHSRFLPEDRQRIENDLIKYFGKNMGSDYAGSVIAIATQTIEVGVDITSENLHTELAPASALIQRAGRCARYPGEQGKVIVYSVENFRPYAKDSNDKGWGREMQSAYEWLQSHTNEVFDFSKEQDFVNAVATPRDQKVLQGLFAGQADRNEEIFRVLGGDKQSTDGRLLIRDADSCRVLIHSDPGQLSENPKSAVGFNLQPMTLYGLFKAWQERADELELEWIVKILIEAKGDQKEDNHTEYGWKSIFDNSQLKGVNLVVVHPALAGYDSKEGFLPDQGDTEFVSSIPDFASEHTYEGYSYNLEAYEDHIQRVLSAFENIILPEFEHSAFALEKAANLPKGSMLEAAWLTCLLHDVGKLSKGWQGWARAYQQAVGNPVPKSFAVAHTNTDRSRKDLIDAVREAERRNPKPHHAAEGALAVAPILFKALPPGLAQAAVTAITRHHTPFAVENQAFNLENMAAYHVSETIGYIPVDMRRGITPSLMRMNENQNPTFAGLLVKPQEEISWMAYIMLVRALRMADQIGTANGNH